MRSILCLVFVLVFCASLSFGQACPGGFWGNGQCIAPCESPMVNPNVSLSFYGYLCQSPNPCIDNNYQYCYPSYIAYDNAYNQYCGVVNDWNDGACYPMPPYLDRFGPKLNRPSTIPPGLFLQAHYNFILKQARPGVKCTYTKKFRKFRKEKGNV